MYDALEARLHDLFWEEEGAPAEFGLLESFLEKHPGTALELGCGSGRLMAPLLEKGFLLEGLDSSREMLELCQINCAPHEPTLHHADMAGFSTGATYSAIAIPAFTLQLVNRDRLGDVFSNIHQHLHPGGGLYLTTFIPWAEITGELEPEQWFTDQQTELPNGHTACCHTQFRINRLSQQLVREHRYEISDGSNVLESSTSTHHLSWYWPLELNSMLVAAGFEPTTMIGDFQSEEPCDEDSQIITITATRRA